MLNKSLPCRPLPSGLKQASSNSQDNDQEDTHTSQGTRNGNHPALTCQLNLNGDGMKTTSCISVFKTFRISSLTFSLDSNCELNSHAYTCVLGKNAYIFLDHDRAVDIIGYDRSKRMTVKNMKTVSGALAYDNQAMGK